MDTNSEKDLVASCKHGNKTAYAGLVRAHSGRIFAICLGLLGNRHDAEDMTQQTLLKGFMQIQALRNSDRFAPWIARIARNLCLDALRVRKHQQAPPVTCKEQQAAPEDLRRLEEALNGLSIDYRMPLLLFYFDGRNTQSIAETLGITQANVQARLSRARKQLRRLLAGEGDDQ